MTKGTKWIIPYSLTTPPQPPTKIAFSWGPVSRHPSNGGELGTFPPRSNFPFTTDGAVTPIPSRNKVPLYGRIWLLSLVPPRNKFPSAEGWHASACRGGLIPTAPGPARRGGGMGNCHPKSWQRVARVTKTGHSPRFFMQPFSHRAVFPQAAFYRRQRLYLLRFRPNLLSRALRT